MLRNIKKILFFISILTALPTQQLLCAEANAAQSNGGQIVVTVNPIISIDLPKSFDEFGNAVEHLVKENKTTAAILGVFAIAPIVYTAYKVNRSIAHYANSGIKWLAGKFWSKETASKIGTFAELTTFLGLSALESYLLITSYQKLATDTRHVLDAIEKLKINNLSINTQQPTLQITQAK